MSQDKGLEQFKKGIDDTVEKINDASANVQRNTAETREQVKRMSDSLADQDEYRIQIEIPASDISMRLKSWERLPQPMKTATSTEISALIEKAVIGDETARQILEVTKAKLVADEVKIANLPNLEWEAKKGE